LYNLRTRGKCDLQSPLLKKKKIDFLINIQKIKRGRREGKWWMDMGKERKV